MRIICIQESTTAVPFVIVNGREIRKTLSQRAHRSRSCWTIDWCYRRPFVSRACSGMLCSGASACLSLMAAASGDSNELIYKRARVTHARRGSGIHAAATHESTRAHDSEGADRQLDRTHAPYARGRATISMEGHETVAAGTRPSTFMTPAPWLEATLGSARAGGIGILSTCVSAHPPRLREFRAHRIHARYHRRAVRPLELDLRDAAELACAVM